MNAPVFSIITVVRNDVAGVIRTMKSIFSQSFADYEVIVQDCLSTDGTTEVLQGFGDWIDSHVVERDSGIYDAMNRALARATGDWVLFLNAADCFVNAQVLETVVRAVQPQDDIFVGLPISDEDGTVVHSARRDRFWSGSINDHQATFVRRKLAQKLRFNPDFKVSGDLDFFLRARDLGARDRFEPIQIVRKPYAVGASSDFMDRFVERAPLLLGRYEADYPVRKTLHQQLGAYARDTYDPAPGVIEAMSLDALQAAVGRWRARLRG